MLTEQTARAERYMSDAEIEDRFRYHAPTPEARRRHEVITEASIVFAKVVRDNVPFSRGQSLALTSIEEARMWANQGIATNHDKLSEPGAAIRQMTEEEMALRKRMEADRLDGVVLAVEAPVR